MWVVQIKEAQEKGKEEKVIYLYRQIINFESAASF